MANDVRLYLPSNLVDQNSYLEGTNDLFDAILSYDATKIKSYLNSDNIQDVSNLRDERGRTALHVLLLNGVMGHLNRTKLLECLCLLISYGCDVNEQDTESGECPLSLAVHHSFESCAMLLVKNGANTSARTTKYSKPGSLCLQIAMTMPTVMIEVLNQGIILDYGKIGTSVRPLVKLDWSPVLQYSENADRLPICGITGRKHEVLRETSFLYSLLNIECHETLDKYMSHPLVSAFLNFKHRKTGTILLWTQILLCFLTLIYLVFIYAFYFKNCTYLEREEIVQGRPTADQLCSVSKPLSIAAIVLTMVGVTLLCVGIYILSKFRGTIMRSWRFWVILISLTIMLFTLWPALTFKKWQNISGQYPITVIATFLGWVMLLIQFEFYPPVKVHFEMLVSIVFSVLKIIALFSPLLIGFFMGLHLMFFESGNIMNFIFMAAAVEPGRYEEMISQAKDPRDWFTIPAYILTVVFTVVIAIVFVNFVLAVSIHDIQDLKKKASIITSSKRVQSFYIFDFFFPKFKQVTDQGARKYFKYDPAESIPELPDWLRSRIMSLVMEKHEENL